MMIIYVTLSIILSLFAVVATVFALNIELRAVFGVNQEIIAIEAYIFKRFRIARLNGYVHDGELYFKFKRKPYRKVSRLMDKLGSRRKSKTEEIYANGQTENKKAEKSAPVKIKDLRINVTIGANDAMTTSFLWSAVAVLASGLDHLVKKYVKIDKYNAFYRPRYDGSDLLVDIHAKIGMGEVLRLIGRAIAA